jgi:hypothetical protein
MEIFCGYLEVTNALHSNSLNFHKKDPLKARKLALECEEVRHNSVERKELSKEVVLDFITRFEEAKVDGKIKFHEFKKENPYANPQLTNSILKSE